MLLRLWAILRSLYLLGIVGYAIWATPWLPLTVARNAEEQYARCVNILAPLQRAVWLAIGWIALDAIVGWLVVWKNSHDDRTELKKALREARATQATQPPPPPPPTPPPTT